MNLPRNAVKVRPGHFKATDPKTGITTHYALVGKDYKQVGKSTPIPKPRAEAVPGKENGGAQ